MKALIIRQPGGLQNTRIEEVENPESSVVIRVTHAGLNPVDINVMLGKVNYNIAPYPHIPGAEFVGVVESAASSKKFKAGDRVAIYPRIYDGTCERCKDGMEELCRSGGIFGVGCNGGFSEFFGTDEFHLELLPNSMSFEDAVSIAVGGLTAYHALKRAGLKRGDRLLVIGASGNTGWYSMILGNLLGARVYYVSRKKVPVESGISEWKNEKVDVIVNSIGSEAWDPYMDYLDTNGRIVTFGTLTGKDAKLNLAQLYTGERSVIGSTGGSRKEFSELIKLVSENQIKPRLWKTYDLKDYEKAIADYGNREGRIILKVTDP
ncbi:MAG: alcohol dehydrogenase catalytic domain-containing protein [Thermoplasmatales archaeon]|nr:alcohol dehydrogenase catalytic domain-containing protein [Candidatus Thermoplasmatota archaeon]MCL6002157.1 alcohol dehydrogenase catalytic domain-containing protein [Candidatus Thermoplasmatota archaeon]MDA8055961.1 alcohol dehydrogenase catalytic domain-containing protein [Thermoplasmatales archaeon]